MQIGLRTSPVFVLTGDAVQLEAYGNVPEEYEGIPIVRKLVETMTAAEAAVLCRTLRSLRRCEPPVTIVAG